MNVAVLLHLFLDCILTVLFAVSLADAGIETCSSFSSAGLDTEKSFTY